VRVLGVVSGEDVNPTDAGDAPAYRFEGYRVELSDKVELTPHG
jgi:hypothetical protein